jgi:hypothetical protein
MKNNHCVNISHNDSTITKNVYIVDYDETGILVKNLVKGVYFDFRDYAFIAMNYVSGIAPDHFNNSNCSADGNIVEEEI